VPYAEVIGDPVAQSSSPAIHKNWLGQLRMEGDFRATRVPPDELEDYFSLRRADPDWRGCSVTIPHKQAVLRFLDCVDPAATAMGAVNCIGREADLLTGRNTDVDGVAAALDPIQLEGEQAVLIGAGGAARAAIHYLQQRRVRGIVILVRDPAKAIRELGNEQSLQLKFRPLDECDGSFDGARLIVNASPMGMEGQNPMPAILLASLAEQAAGKVLFDMVYKPIETDFLATGAANGAVTIGGMKMLVGQARAAFQAFFGSPAPVR
ncbi:MAG TPA: shikimate dehydrogenase, partial [Allosphingosinicella sp.]|nr:shikimate dehydrogenase [Allosphingosinicella sp.]